MPVFSSHPDDINRAWRSQLEPFVEGLDLSLGVAFFESLSRERFRMFLANESFLTEDMDDG